MGDLVRLESRPIPASVVRENQRYSLFVNWEYVGTDKMRQAYIKRGGALVGATVGPDRKQWWNFDSVTGTSPNSGVLLLPSTIRPAVPERNTANTATIPTGQ